MSTNLKFGRKPAIFDKRTLKLEDYLSTSFQAPHALNWYGKVKNWGMMLNDELGDCTCAAAGHCIMNWTANAGVLVTPPDSAILTAYEAVGGYNPNVPLVNGENPTDNGAVELDVLKYWQDTGVAGHKIGAFVSINPRNINHLKIAMWLFGGIYTGVNLSQSDMDATNDGKIWEQNSDPIIGGHAIPAFGYDDDGIQFITWGQVQTASYGWVENRVEEAYAIVSQDWIANTSKAPSGFNMTQLIADLKSVKN